MDLKRMLKSGFRKREQQAPRRLLTPWGERLDPRHVLEEHPRPQLCRSSYVSLNGVWAFAIAGAPPLAGGGHLFDRPAAEVAQALAGLEPPASWERDIVVPFSPETILSGVCETVSPDEVIWYRYVIENAQQFVDGLTEGADSETPMRVLLHFEAVDHVCAVWCGGVLAGTHVGGYLPFAVDATAGLEKCGDGPCELVVCAYDPSDAGVQPRGKQKVEHDGIWYTPTSGIWQPVWAEAVPALHVGSLRTRADLDGACVEFSVGVVGFCADAPARVRAVVSDRAGGRFEGVGAVVAGAGNCPDGDAADRDGDEGDPDGAVKAASGATGTALIEVRVPEPHAWSLDDPFLYDVELELEGPGSRDVVRGYCAFRTTTIEPDDAGHMRFCLNHKPLLLRGVLDQGYWSDGSMTAPSDEALVHDIESMRRHGFNLLRKHIKIERDRWYYHCDRLGMLVLQDMVSGGDDYSVWYTSRWPTLMKWTWDSLRDDTGRGRRRMAASDERYRAEWSQTCAGAIRHLGNHPCIVAWGLFNEAWGQFDAREAVRAVRRLDPTRPIDATSGWYDQDCGEFVSIHNYFRPLAVYPDRRRLRRIRHEGGAFASGEAGCVSCGDPDGKADRPLRPRAFLISEFGGLTLFIAEHSMLSTSYGYEDFDDPGSWRAAFSQKIAEVDALEADGLAGYVYTQLSDVEEETNGLLTFDRRVDKLGG